MTSPLRRTNAALVVGASIALMCAGGLSAAAQVTGVIRGKVTDATTGRPVDGAQLYVAGTDLGTTGIVSGASLHDELALLVDAGYTPAEALRFATLNPARFLGLSDSLGTVEAGKIADLVLLERDPLADIRNTRRIAVVIQAGTVLPYP